MKCSVLNLLLQTWKVNKKHSNEIDTKHSINLHTLMVTFLMVALVLISSIERRNQQSKGKCRKENKEL